MMRWIALCAMTLAMGVSAQTARADDANTMSALAGGVSLLGQSAGGALTGADSILVTDSGHAHITSDSVAAYAAAVSGQADTAVAAAAIRDAKIAKLREVAQRFGSNCEIANSGFAMQTDAKAQAERQRQWAAERAAHPGEGFVPIQTDDLPEVFVAQSTVRFGAPANNQNAAFLDALRAAGAGEITDLFNSAKPNVNIFASQLFGSGQTAAVSPEVWNTAGIEAIHKARDQALVLANAAGRNLGDATQITFLAKNTEGGEVTVTVAVRFALIGGKTP